MLRWIQRKIRKWVCFLDYHTTQWVTPHSIYQELQEAKTESDFRRIEEKIERIKKRFPNDPQVCRLNSTLVLYRTKRWS